MLIYNSFNNTAKATEGESTPQYNKENYMNTGLLRRSFRVYGFLTVKENIRSFHPSFLELSFLQPRLTVSVYHDFLQNAVVDLLQDGVLESGINSWFMHNGAQSHCFLAVRELNNVFPAQRIRVAGPTAWTACFPHLNPLHFYLWEQQRATVYATEVNNFQKFQQRIPNGLGDHSCDKRNFPASQAVTVETCNVLLWISR